MTETNEMDLSTPVSIKGTDGEPTDYLETLFRVGVRAFVKILKVFGDDDGDDGPLMSAILAMTAARLGTATGEVILAGAQEVANAVEASEEYSEGMSNLRVITMAALILSESEVTKAEDTD